MFEPKLKITCILPAGTTIEEFGVVENNLSWVNYFHLLDMLYTMLREKGIEVEYKMDHKTNNVVIGAPGETLAPIVYGFGGLEEVDPYVTIRADWCSEELEQQLTIEMFKFYALHLAKA